MFVTKKAKSESNWRRSNVNAASFFCYLIAYPLRPPMGAQKAMRGRLALPKHFV